MDQVRVGVIGSGAFARSEHFPNCVKNPRVDLVTACSRSEDKRMGAVRDFGARKAEADAAKVFADPEIDLIILSVPHDVHFEMVIGALEAGKHVLCEKPMAMTMEESYEIVRAVKRAGTKLCVDYNRRFSPSMQHMKAQYMAHRASPGVSDGQFVEDAKRPPLPEEEASMLMIRINDESSTYRPVHLDWHTGGGQIIGETCHWLDLACWLLEETPTRVYATGSARLSHIVSLDFAPPVPGAQGHRACIMFSPVGTFEYPKELFELMDHAALFRNLCFVETETYGAAGFERKTFPLQFDDCPEVGEEGGLSGYIAKLQRRAQVHAESGKTVWPDLFPDKGHYQLLDAFVDAIIRDKPSPIDERAGAQATYLSLRAIESIRTGMPLPVNLEEYRMFVN
ncbi:Gfo/Idh/MocA family oxidoreductase [bacterium]|nr:Gfo/Idh/MocA family oxidoreductase [bacterium]